MWLEVLGTTIAFDAQQQFNPIHSIEGRTPLPYRYSMTMMISTRIRRILVLALLANWLLTVSAIDVVVDMNKFKCESRPIKAKLSYICNPNSICTVGDEAESIEGERK